jgi:hypothetical protein
MRIPPWSERSPAAGHRPGDVVRLDLGRQTVREAMSFSMIDRTARCTSTSAVLHSGLPRGEAGRLHGHE